MRILILNQWFDPEPTVKGLGFARALVARGHSVEVLTGFPNYPGGRLYENYRIRWRQVEVLEGIRVIRVPLYPSHDGSSLRRVLNYCSFAASAATLGTCSVSRPDIVYMYHPPATVGLAALALRVLRGVPFVCDIQDLWPDSIAASGMMSSRLLNGLVGAWCRMLYKTSSQIVVLSPGFKNTLVGRGVPEHKLHVIYNWCDETALDADRNDCLTPEPSVPDRRFKVVFAGTMGKVQGLTAVLQAAALVQGSGKRIEFLFVGGGVEVERLQATAAALGLKNVEFLPRRPLVDIGVILRSADALLVHLKDEPLFRITIPSKTQAYMNVGKPILMAVKGDAADLVIRSRCGVVCEPENPRAIADAVLLLEALRPEARAEMGRNGRRYYDAHLSLHVGLQEFEHLFERAAAG